MGGARWFAAGLAIVSTGVRPCSELGKAAGVKFIACDMAMGVMGLTREELIDEVDEVAGVAAFAELARKSTNTLFI